MLKTTMIVVASLSALLFSGNSKETSVEAKQKTTVDTTRLKVGDEVPDIVFRDTTGHVGNDMRLRDLKGKYVLIDVWASWCYPCRIQQPYLLALEEKMKNKAITFVRISIDTHEWRWKGPNMPGIQWMVRDKVFEQVFGINTIPRFILLDKSGRVLKLNATLPSHPELEQELNQLKGI